MHKASVKKGHGAHGRKGPAPQREGGEGEFPGSDENEETLPEEQAATPGT